MRKFLNFFTGQLSEQLPFIVLLVGEGVLALGVGLISFPAGVIAAGLLLIADAVLMIFAGGGGSGSDET